ncbi:MAG: (deoxy)nucleoside triphosphate pyrophosphohydrolase [Novosphingobium sp.]
MIPVVAAALIGSDGAVLLQKRSTGAHAGLWEFPGGKVEPHEAPEDALCREIAEELGIALDRANLVPLAFASDPSEPASAREPYVIMLYLCRKWHGEPAALEEAAVAWFELSALAELPMPPLDRPLVAALQRAI